MRHQHLSGVREVGCMLLLLAGTGALQGCAVEPHQLTPAINVPSSTVIAARSPSARSAAARVAAAARPAASRPTARTVAAQAAAAHASVTQAAAAGPAQRVPGWQVLPGATYAGTTPRAVAAVPLPAATPVLEPVVLRDRKSVV